MLKNAAFYPIWLYTNIVSLSGLVEKMTTCQLINMHISNNFPSISCSYYQLSNIDIYLKLKNMQVLCQHFRFMSMQ